MLPTIFSSLDNLKSYLYDLELCKIDINSKRSSLSITLMGDAQEDADAVDSLIRVSHSDPKYEKCVRETINTCLYSKKINDIHNHAYTVSHAQRPRLALHKVTKKT